MVSAVRCRRRRQTRSGLCASRYRRLADNHLQFSDCLARTLWLRRACRSFVRRCDYLRELPSFSAGRAGRRTLDSRSVRRRATRPKQGNYQSRAGLVPQTGLRGFAMVTKKHGVIIETPTEARQAERGPSVLLVLTVSLIAVAIGMAAVWYIFFRT